MIDRRMALGGAAGLALASAAARVGAQGAARVRFNVASPQGQAMLAVYAAGVAKMKALPAADPRSWTFSWYTHWAPTPKASVLQQVFGSDRGPAYQLASATWDTCQAHDGVKAHEPYFVFWHRLYVLYLERMIGALTGTPGFTLPYWDYTTPANAALPVAFRTPGHPVWGALYQPNRNVQGNGYANVNGGDPIDKYAPGALSLDVLSEPDFLSFNQTLDQNLHGNVHDLVGNTTNMGYVPTAAQDPIFWLHHCNIDRIWYAWAQAGGVNPTDFTNTFTFTNPDGTPAVAALNTVASNGALNYRYDALPAAPRLLTASVRATGPERVLLSSAPTGRLMASSGLRLTGQPAVVRLSAPSKQRTLGAVLHAPGAPSRLRLVLRDVVAEAPPGTVFTVYLNLPEGVRPDDPKAAAYRVGTLNFFDAVAMPGMAQMGGRDHVFDLTGVARRLAAGGALTGATVVTIAPSGAPQSGSAPTIRGSIEVTGR